MRPRGLRSAAGAAAIIAACVPASDFAAESSEPTITMIVENDSFVHRLDDRHYTNGVYLSWTSGASLEADSYTALTDFLLASQAPNSATYRHGGFFGQSIFTPENLSRVRPDQRDRPYAGWLYLGGDLYRETTDELDRVEAQLGVVGPWSLAEDAQIWIHAIHVFGGVHPRGWASQLHNEPGLVLTRQHIWRKGMMRIGPLETEALPEVNVSLGNVLTYAGAGVTLRFGEHLGADWGAPEIAPALEGANFVNYDDEPISWYAFVGFEARAIARNIFLDGNSFRESANIAKNPFVGDAHLGFAITGRSATLYIAYTLRSEEFKTQRNNDQFLALGLSFAY